MQHSHNDASLLSTLSMQMEKMDATITGLRKHINILRQKAGLPQEKASSFEAEEGTEESQKQIAHDEQSNPAPSKVNDGSKYLVHDEASFDQLLAKNEALLKGDVLASSIDKKYQWAGTPDDFRITGHFIRRLTHYTHYQLHTSQSYGHLNGRTLRFRKVHQSSGLRIVWTDNFRVYVSGTACQWQIYINNNLCSYGRFAKYDGSGTYYVNKHGFATFTTTCWGVPAGTATINTRVYPAPGYHNYGRCWTGWHTMTNMEVEEVL
eukprot:TRINITY_DN665_c0_g1_i1.p2 TRINITY_DN665_c0_g1~~TRINITY_DN665_c0_g1_i1.p2  ORF type:complete len:264 (-),score=76.37 TRINITY_DN665_c0_g1_i1:353-1144(-)